MNQEDLARIAKKLHVALGYTLGKANYATTAAEGELLAKELIEQCSQLADAVIKLAKYHRREAHKKTQTDLFSEKGTS